MILSIALFINNKRTKLMNGFVDWLNFCLDIFRAITNYLPVILKYLPILVIFKIQTPAFQ